MYQKDFITRATPKNFKNNTDTVLVAHLASKLAHKLLASNAVCVVME
jgi:DNA-directed RNA polymerase subunit E'/Rpb7